MYKRLILFLLLPAVAGCAGGPATAQAPTPTPLPPAPALERPTYTVQRGEVERALELTGRVTPVDLERLSFRTSGRVAEVKVRRGDTVQAGDLLAEIIHEEALETLRQAEVRLAQAERDLATAQANAERQVARAELDLSTAQRNLQEERARLADDLRAAEIALQRAEEDLAALLAGEGPRNLVAEAERKLEQAERDAKTKKDAASEAKTRAEHALIAAAETIEARQRAYSDAFWDQDWVSKYGTHPREKIVDPASGAERHRPLSDEEKRAFERALADAERELRAAERALELAKRDVDLAREAEVVAVRQADEQVALARQELELLREGRGNDAIDAARRRVEDARRNLETARRASAASAEASATSAALNLESAREQGLDLELSTLEEARLNLERAQRVVDEGRVIAPRAGTIVAVGIGVGDLVEPYEPVIELADPSRLEIAAELTAEQMRELAEGMPAEARPAARPDLVLPAEIRLMPAPYGSGGSGAVAEQDRTTRFSLLGDGATDLESGAVVRLHVPVERVADALWLPPEAIRSFEGRQFVVVREGQRERRVPIRTGIASDERVEILEGLAEGDLVVGP